MIVTVRDRTLAVTDTVSSVTGSATVMVGPGPWCARSPRALSPCGTMERLPASRTATGLSSSNPRFGRLSRTRSQVPCLPHADRPSTDPSPAKVATHLTASKPQARKWFPVPQRQETAPVIV